MEPSGRSPFPPFDEPLIVAKEKHLVLEDRTADRTTELILELARESGAPRPLSERILREVRSALTIIKRRAMELVRAGFRLRGHHRRNSLTELGVVVLRRNLGSDSESKFGFTTMMPRIGSWLSVPSNS